MGVKCELCGEGFEHITWSHLEHRHGLTVLEYRIMFPSADLVSEEYREEVSRSSSFRWQSEETKALRSRNMLKNWEDPVYRKIMEDSQQGRVFSEEHRRHISEARLEINKDPEYIRKVSESVKKLWEDPEYVARQQKSRQIKPNVDELWLLGVLKENFPGEWEYTGDLSFMVGSRNPDYRHTTKPLVIELFGEYWHSFDPSDKTSEEATIGYYNSRGYKCLVLWTDEVYSEEFVVSKVNLFMKEA